MKITHRSLKISGNLAYLFSAAFVIAAIIMTLIPPQPVSAEAQPVPSGAGNPGAIWTTLSSCGDETQDANHYSIGDPIYINGKGFDANTTYSWDITGNPGGASGDPNIAVASGDFTTDDTGAFCFNAYTVATDDWGEYQVKFGTKGDNYRVEKNTEIPGCTDPKALNYDPDATKDDGTCQYQGEIPGCTDPLAINYDPQASQDDASCQYPPDINVTTFCSYVDLDKPHGWTVTNPNDFPIEFSWVHGSESSSSPITLLSGAGISFTTGTQAGEELKVFVGDLLLDSVEPSVCPAFLPLQLTAFCMGADASTHGWTATNPNAFDVDAEWRVNGSLLAGLLSIPANSAVNFSTPKTEGAIVQIYSGGVVQDDASAAQQCASPEVPPDVPETPVIVITVPENPNQVLIPVTGFSDDLSGLAPAGMLSLGFTSFGLGTVLHGISRRRKIKNPAEGVRI